MLQPRNRTVALDKGESVVPLNPRQELFIGFYLADPNATQAAVKAGYSVRSAKMQGNRLMTYDDVRAAVAKGQAIIAEKAEITQEWLVGEFKENHRLAREGNPVIDRYGKPTGGVMRQIGASNKALEAIAVITGYWVNKTKVGIDSDLMALMERIDGRTRGLESGSAQQGNRLISLDSEK